MRDHLRDSRNDKTKNGSQVKRKMNKLVDKELTYESERSSTFNENIAENMSFKDNIGLNHVYKGLEEHKKSPPNELSREYDRLESNRSAQGNTNIQ